MPGKTIFAIVAILILDTIALIKGIDGKYLLISIFAIAGLGGYPLLHLFRKRNHD